MSRAWRSMSKAGKGAIMATDPAVQRRATGVPPPWSGPVYAVRLHQVLVTQAAAVLVLIGAVAGGPAPFAAVACAAILLGVTWVRARGRWAFEWIAAGLRFGVRRRATATVLGLAASGTWATSAELPGGPAAVLADAAGLTMLLELGDPAALLAEAQAGLPAPWELLPPDGRERPPGQVQLLLTGVPAPATAAGNGPVAGSYRLLTEGRALGHARAVLAVRVLRAEGWPEGELRRALTGQARRLAKRLPAQPLDRAAAVRTLTDFAYADPATPVHEEWTSLRVGDLSQITFHGFARAGAGPSAELITLLLHLPVTATTVTLTADLPEPGSVEPPLLSLAVRLAAPEAAMLEAATEPLRQLIAGEGIRLRRRDGEHLPGLTATLPLGATGHPPHPGRRRPGTTPGPGAGDAEAVGDLPGVRQHRPLRPGRRTRSGEHRSSGGEFGRLALPTSGAGLTVGRNRHGHPVLIRLFRPEPTRVLLVGGLRCTQLVAFRAMALGARVLVRTYRPRDWEPFARGTAAPAGTIGIVTPDQPVKLPPSSPLYPLLTILDVGRPTPPPTGPTVTRPSGTVRASPSPRGVTVIGPPSETATYETPDLGTADAGTPAPGTAGPWTTAPGTAAPWTTAPGTAAPGTAAPGTAAPGTARPGTAASGVTGSVAAASGTTDSVAAARRTTASGTATAQLGNSTEGGPWRATVTVREEFGVGDVGDAIGADLLMLQTLRPDEADLIGAALALGDTAGLLTRMRPGMVGVINRQAVRWAMLSPTSVEKVLIGDLSHRRQMSNRSR